jgi:hypothetical protein
MSDIPRLLREQVIKRAGNHCEYCQLSQVGQEAAFHIDHVHPRALNGPTSLDNLALACVSCSLRKCARVSAPDPENGLEVQLYNPRSQKWSENFRWRGTAIIPVTSTGRATVDALSMNRTVAIEIRMEESVRGRHPPQISQQK